MKFIPTCELGPALSTVEPLVLLHGAIESTTTVLNMVAQQRAEHVVVSTLYGSNFFSCSEPWSKTELCALWEASEEGALLQGCVLELYSILEPWVNGKVELNL